MNSDATTAWSIWDRKEGNEQGADEWRGQGRRRGKGTRRGRKTEGGKWTKGRREMGRKVKTTGQDEEWKKGRELTEEGNVGEEQKI